MILLARGTCGIGFIGLCVNALLPEPSLLAIYLLGLWDGFFASLGVTALLAATPALVGRKSDAGRRDYHADGTSGIGYFADVGRHIACQRRRSLELWAGGSRDIYYVIAATDTAATACPSAAAGKSIYRVTGGISFLLASPLIGGIALLGGLVTMASAVRVLYPALAMSWQMSAAQIGLLYAAIPLGAAIGALTSGQLAHSVRPGLIMLVSTVGSFLAVGLFAIMPVWIAGVICLALFGWLSAISSLLQYTLLQTQTPENMLGRMNGLWTAQNVTGDAIGAALLGGLGAMMTPVASASVSGFGLVIIGLLLLLALGELRRFRQTPPVSDAG